jgi:3-oxoacyl-[acyl-carrier protein] reductase
VSGIEGQVAVVTGAGRGMGRAEALRLAAAGVAVVVNDLPGDGGPDPADAVAQSIRDRGGRAVAVSCSVASFAAGQRLVDVALAEFGRLDIVCTTAGTYRMGPMEELTEDGWDAVLAVNLTGTFAPIRAALPVFREQRSGVVVTMSSDAGTGDFFNGVYAATKEGVVGLTRAVAREYGRYGVRCNAVRPRAFDTGMANETSWRAMYEFDTAFGRPPCGVHRYTPRAGTAAEVAEVVAWLCGPAAAHVNGCVVQAGCGEVGLWRDPEVTRSSYHPGGLTAEIVDVAAVQVFAAAADPYATLPAEAYRDLDERVARQQRKLDVAENESG